MLALIAGGLACQQQPPLGDEPDPLGSEDGSDAGTDRSADTEDAKRAAPPRENPRGRPRSSPLATALLPEPRPIRVAGTLTGGRRTALIICADDYVVDERGRLGWGLPQALASAKRLRSALIERAGFRDEDVTILDSKNVLRTAIERQLGESYTSKLEGHDNLLLVYYVGHGMEHDRHAWLFLHDTAPSDRTGFAPVLGFDELQGWMRRAQEDVRRRGADLTTVLMVDACRVAVGAPPSSMVIEATADVVVSSSGDDQFAHADAKEFVFSAELAGAIDELAKRGEASVRQVFEAAESRTRARLKDAQTPWLREQRKDVALVAKRTFRIECVAVDGLLGEKGIEKELDGASILFNGRDPASGVRPTKYTVTVEADGFLPYETELELTQADAGKSFLFPMFPSFVLVRARLVDSRGEPLGGYVVDVTGEPGIEGYHSGRTASDGAGNITIKVPPEGGDRVLRIGQRSDAAASVPLHLDGAQAEWHGGLRVPILDLGDVTVAASHVPVRGARIEIANVTPSDGDIELGVPVKVEFPGNLELPGITDVSYAAAQRFAKAGRLDRALDKLREITEGGGESLPQETRSALDALEEDLRLAIVVDAARTSAARGREVIRDQLPSTTAAHAEALHRLAANLDARDWRGARESDPLGAARKLLDAAKSWASTAARDHYEDAVASDLLARAKILAERDRHEEALEFVRLAGTVRDAKAVESAMLREIARRSFEGEDYGRADRAVSECAILATTDSDRRDLEAQRLTIRLRWLESELRQAIREGGWDRVKALARESREIVGDDPELLRLADSVERESIDPATRELIAKARSRARGGGAADLEEAEKLYREARPSANQHYGALIDAELRDVGDRLYRLYSNLAVEIELGSGDEFELFRAQIARARYRPAIAARDLLRMWNGSDAIRNEFRSEESFLEEVDDWIAAQRAERNAARPEERKRLWQDFVAGHTGGRLTDRAHERILAAERERLESERQERERQERERQERERQEHERAALLAMIRGERGARAPERVRAAQEFLGRFGSDAAAAEVRAIARRLDSEAAIEREGFRFLQRNSQGYDEYRHEKTGIVFVLLPGGTFEMGSPDSESYHQDDEGPVHRVTLSPFLIAKCEVTQAEWRKVTGESPSSFKSAGDNAPVESVSWEDCRDKFFAKTGLRFPTDAEWEYACRAGTRTANYAGDSDRELDAIAWYSLNSGSETHPVGKKAPNGFGLYDMIGNVWEWCEDVYDSDFYGKAEALKPDPVSKSGSGDRVLRGGSWSSGAWDCRSAARYGYSPSYRSYDVGLRPAASLPAE